MKRHTNGGGVECRSLTATPAKSRDEYKILVIGDSGVGKSSLLLQFTDHDYPDRDIATIGCDYKTRVVKLNDGSPVKIRVWDTAGQERFRTITSSYYRGAHGAALVFDITETHTFERLECWVRELQRFAPEYCVKVVVGNKSDCSSERKVSILSAKEFASKEGLVYMETSAKNNINVDEAFLEIAEQIRAKWSDIETKDAEDKRLRRSKQIMHEYDYNMTGEPKCCC